MKSSNPVAYPSLSRRLYSVWYRHVRVYTKNLLSNGLPPFLEPLLFLAGVGLGLSKYITQSMEGLSYIEFLGTGLLVTAAMFTAAYECTFGTFIRLEFEKVYDGMLAAPITVNDLIIGEIIWAGTKGVFFTFAVLCVLTAFRIVRLPEGLLTPLVGFITGVMFATLSLWVTSFVKTIQHFNFYLTGVLSPMFFFSGVVFPVSNLPSSVRFAAEIMPLTHCVRLARAVCIGQYPPGLLLSLAYAVVFTVLTGWLAIRRLRRRLIR
ncbi:MAG: ABC transporter permease [Planctomycetes bacterium]|jgi:lipooligosaccharide transport system permease protein|nr:ABC transporter permease [Planctomycetota bacterium]